MKTKGVKKDDDNVDEGNNGTDIYIFHDNEFKESVSESLAMELVT